MAENQPPPSTTAPASSDTPGAPFYEKSRAQLKELIRRKALLERNLANQEDAIFKKETEYLEDTPQGNIITGFEGYVKGGVQAAQRRGGTRVLDANRVFSRSSVSFQPGGTDSPMETAQSTPMAASAPTPLSASFAKGDGASNHATPTSATSANKNGAGTAATAKKNKKVAGGEESDMEKDSKKARTNFGATRK